MYQPYDTACEEAIANGGKPPKPCSRKEDIKRGEGKCWEKEPIQNTGHNSKICGKAHKTGKKLSKMFRNIIRTISDMLKDTERTTSKHHHISKAISGYTIYKYNKTITHKNHKN